MLALLVSMIIAPLLYLHFRRQRLIAHSPKQPASAPFTAPKTIGTQPIPPPEQRLRTAYKSTFYAALFSLTAAVSLFFSLIPQLSFAYTTEIWPLYLKSTIAGVLLLALAFLLKRRSLSAARAAVTIFTLNSLVDFIWLLNNSPNAIGLIAQALFSLFLLALMSLGPQAIRELKQADLNPSEQL